jgi:Ca2+-transporting ATPase
MRHPRSKLLQNEVTRNPWVWAALLLCTALLVAPAYLTPVAHILHLTAPDLNMWAVIIGMSVAPLILLQGTAPFIRSPQRH